MIVGQRREFYKDLSYDAYPRLFDSQTRQIIEILDNAAQVPAEFHHRRISLGQGSNAAFLPLLMEFVGASWDGLVWPCAVKNSHKHIAVYHSLKRFCQKRKRDSKARVCLLYTSRCV